jgi:hypothetical protein
VGYFILEDQLKKILIIIALTIVVGHGYASAGEVPTSWRDIAIFLGKPDAVASLCVRDENLAVEQFNRFFDVRRKINNLIQKIAADSNDELLPILMLGESRDLQNNDLFQQTSLKPYGGCTDALLIDLNNLVNDIEKNAIKPF